MPKSGRDAPLAWSLNSTLRPQRVQSWDCRLCQNHPRLAPLDVSQCKKVRDLSALSQLHGLKVLDISSCPPITDLRPMAGLTGLVRLNAEGCGGVSNLQPLSGLTRLTVLDLGRMEGIVDLRPLTELQQLEFLSLRECKNAREAAEVTGKMPRLKGLCLPPGLTDGELASVCERHTNLVLLGLCGCRKITSLAALRKIAGLKVLRMDIYIGLTDAEIATFKKDIPGCRIQEH